MPNDKLEAAIASLKTAQIDQDSPGLRDVLAIAETVRDLRTVINTHTDFIERLATQQEKMIRREIKADEEPACGMECPTCRGRGRVEES